MMPREELLRILKMKEISKLPTLREKELYLRRRLATQRAAPRITQKTLSRRTLNYAKKFKLSMNKVVWKKELCKKSQKSKSLILLSWRDSLLMPSTIMTETEPSGKVSLISLKTRKTSTRKIQMRLSSNSKRMLSNFKKCRVMVRARQNKPINRFLLNRRLSTMLVLRIFKIRQMKLFMKLNRRLNLQREN